MGKSLAAAVLIALATLSVPATAAAAPAEDQPGFSCITDGNRICGPNNANGAAAGCYDDTAQLVAPWPCHIVVDQNGDADVYTGLVDTHGQPVECRDICLGA